MQSFHPAHLLNAIKWRTLVALAKVHRRYLNGVPFIGITGSCAKTTTKTLLAGILSERYRVAQNPGSKNRTEALAKTILRTKRKGLCIQELGASGIGSLDAMVALFKPTIAVITNVMRDHFTAYRSLEAIALEKSKLVAALSVSGTAVLNADDPLVLEMGDKTEGNKLTYGFSEGADLRAVGFNSPWPGYLNGNVIWQGRRYPVVTRLLGEHWAPAVLAAMGAALSLGMAMKEIVARLAIIDPPEGRYSTEFLPNGVTMICDDFKSPMHSIQPALSFLQTAGSKRKIVVVGHISDYSNSSSHGYKRVASEAIAVCDKVLLVNRFASPRLSTLSRRHRERVHCFDRLEEVKDFLVDYLRPGDLVLLKGIRKMDHFERVVMAFNDGVACWESKCGYQAPCGECPRRDRAAP